MNASNKLLGDIMIMGACILFGLTQTMMEKFSKNVTGNQFLSRMAIGGFLMCLIVSMATEAKEYKNIGWKAFLLMLSIGYL